MDLKFDSTSKLMLVIFIVLTSYLFVISVISLPFGINPGDNIFNFSTSGQSTLNLVALIVSVGIGFAVSLMVRAESHRVEKQASVHSTEPHQKASEIDILKRALSKDEKAVLEEVEKAGEITQDSLRYRLNFSKAKVSAIITNLDRMNLIQRERQGKTYKIFLEK